MSRLPRRAGSPPTSTRPGGQRLQAEDRPQQAGLARPVRAEHGEELAALDDEVQLRPQHPVAEGERGVAQFEDASAS